MMRRLGMLILAASVAAVLPVVGDETKADKKESKDGWVQLFNGKDLTGWKVYSKSKEKKESKTGSWKVKDGAIVGSGGVSHLFTERDDFKNFHVRAEVKINDKGNSGLYVRVQYGPGFPRGYEVQINATHSDRVRTASIYPDYREKDLKGLKEILVLKAPHKADEWFTLEAICVGAKLTTKVDGKTMIEWTDPKHRYKKGHVALQQHDDKSVVQFRKIEVKELPDDKE